MLATTLRSSSGQPSLFSRCVQVVCVYVYVCVCLRVRAWGGGGGGGVWMSVLCCQSVSDPP
jgi:hypothetical protein